MMKSLNFGKIWCFKSVLIFFLFDWQILKFVDVGKKLYQNKYKISMIAIYNNIEDKNKIFLMINNLNLKSR